MPWAGLICDAGEVKAIPGYRRSVLYGTPDPHLLAAVFTFEEPFDLTLVSGVAIFRNEFDSQPIAFSPPTAEINQIIATIGHLEPGVRLVLTVPFRGINR